MEHKKTYGGYDYAFSVIMAVYNVAPYLREAVDSLVNQTFGFEGIQVVLVDDGSTDESPAICDEYQQKYPDNVVAVHKKNGGVSSARNEGMKHARGQYWNFMDPDDKLSLNTMNDVFSFFRMHEGKTDIAAIPMHYFDAEEKPHIQNFKFDGGTRIINLLEEWAIPHASASSSFITADMASRFTFDTRVTYGEDACYVNKIMLHKAAIGMVATAAYHYRKRASGNSAMQNSRSRKAWYLPSVHYFMEELLRYALEVRGEVPLFTQYNVMYDMQWRITQSVIGEDILTAAELQEYRETVYRILSQLDDRVIMAQRFLTPQHKYYALRRNHQDAPRMMFQGAAPVLAYGDYIVASSSNIEVVYTSISVQQHQLYLTGYLSVPNQSFEQLSLSLYCNQKAIPCPLTPSGMGAHFLGDPICQKYTFQCHIRLNPAWLFHIAPALVCNGLPVPLQNIRFDFCAPLTTVLPRSYALAGGYCITRIGPELVIRKRSILRGLFKELGAALDLYRKGLRKAMVVRLAGKMWRRMSRMNNYLIYGGNDPDHPGLHRLIDQLKEESPRARLHVLFAPGVKPGKLDGAEPVQHAETSMRYKMFVLTCKRICFRMEDWTSVNPYAHVDSPYRDLLSGTDFMLLNEDFTLQTSYLCDSPRMPLTTFLRKAAGRVRRLVGRVFDKTIKRVYHAFLRKLPQNYVLFESVPPYSDNTWAVYRHICDHHLLQGCKLLWLLQDGEQPRADIPTIVRGKSLLSRIRYDAIAMRTKAFIYCNRTQYKVRPDQLTINLGHGSCLKSVHGHYSMPKDLDYTLIQAPAFEGATRYEHNFADSTIIAALGYPRNDDFFGNHPLDRNTLFEQPFKKLVIWYPTYRQHKNGRNIASSITLPLIHDADAARRINACAAENGVLVVLKPHFAQDTSYITKNSLSNLVFIDDSFFTRHGIRPYQFLHMSDGLITDFSSVYYDYLLQDKPIALVWEDFEEYRQTCGFAVDTDVYCAGGEKVYTEEELCGFIRRIARDEDVLKDPRAQVARLTNARLDGDNARRTAQWIQRIVDAYPDKIHEN